MDCLELIDFGQLSPVAALELFTELLRTTGEKYEEGAMAGVKQLSL